VIKVQLKVGVGQRQEAFVVRFLQTLLRFLGMAIGISVIVIMFGIALVAISEIIRENYGSGWGLVAENLTREFGVVFVSIGLISLLYEVFIRRRLIDDYNDVIREIVDPDTTKLGIEYIFKDRDDKTAKQRSIRELIDFTKKEMMCFVLGGESFLTWHIKLRQKMQEGCSFRFLIFNPGSPYKDALEQSLGPTNVANSLQAKIGRWLKFLRDLKSEFPHLADKIQIRTYDVIPTFGAILIDNDIMVIELFGHQESGLGCPGLEVVSSVRPRGIEGNGGLNKEKSSELYLFYHRQICELWKTGQPFSVDSLNRNAGLPAA
jgi:uncharacterized protein DUF5919